MQDDVSGLTQLGSRQTKYDLAEPSRERLETFPNKYPDRGYLVTFAFPEFTSLCPKTGQPDFATIEICYIPDKLCIETKSLKLYFFSYRSHGSFMETITNRILDDIVATCQPRWCKVIGRFNVRGGIGIVVEAEHATVADAG